MTYSPCSIVTLPDLQIVPAVTELVVAELLWLDYDNPTKPIYLYINSPGTQVRHRLLGALLLL